MDPRHLSLLLSPDGWALLSRLPPYDEDQTLRLSEGLRARGLDPDLIAAALTQSRLRARAEAKFGEFARDMLFTPDGLEQATRLPVAALHAARYARAGSLRVADLGCGLGGDAMALAGLGVQVLAVEQDEATAAIATVNLRAFPEATVRHADAMSLDLAAEGVDALFADPARRTRRGNRVFDPSAYSPDLDSLLALREQVPDLGLKVGPGIPYQALPSQTHAQWVSVDSSVVEAGLWYGRLAPEGSGRSALVIRGTDQHLLSWPGDADARAEQAPTGDLGAYLYEPDGAVIRAGLVARVAAELEGTLVDESIAYVTTGSRRTTPFATCYRILDSFDFGLKRLRSYLRTRDVGRATIKKRGTAVVPEQLRQQLALKGPNEATIVLTRLRGRQSVLVVEPV
ncbi:class I SAM-dependent methyltransferase [Occultella glacieicola]|uniref:Class I SAM-dependent methyltransferase n=1 Tax=Occultella glacieicola TaxID=2518684 RepID=A0ABY2E7V7_9MICO|nr:class I SAM-dependent methyltransferase [Occultella glacieicola]TDE97624.1 class I SAM-dependent methyltransferase [Occultella glacieicola]